MVRMAEGAQKEGKSVSLVLGVGCKVPARDETWRHSHRIERNAVRRLKLEPTRGMIGLLSSIK